ncbi:hypothetical protein ACVDG9_23815 [Roseibium sp. RP-7]
MTIQLEFNDTKNFTGRARIRQKEDLFSLCLLERDEETVRIRVTFDRVAIEKECKLNPAEEKDFILDAFVLGEMHRHVLPEYRGQDEIAISGVPEGASIEFRLKAVSRSEEAQGKILAATGGRVRLKTGYGEKGAGKEDKGIFHPILCRNIGSRIWQIKWNGEGDFEILINADYFYKYHQDPTFEAHVYPEIVRSVANGILMRHETPEDLDENSLVGKWALFIEQRLGVPLTGEDAKHFEDADVVEKLEFVEEIVEAFVNKKWRDGKTLLEEIL